MDVASHQHALVVLSQVLQFASVQILLFLVDDPQLEGRQLLVACFMRVVFLRFLRMEQVQHRRHLPFGRARKRPTNRSVDR